MSSMDHDMMGPSCLEHCLDALHLDVSDDGLVVGGTVVVSSPGDEIKIPVSFSSVSLVQIESHHDPSQILTIQKRE